MRWTVLLVACGLAMLPSPPPQAQVVRAARIESDPSGAQVYLLRGTRRIALGKTPLDYQAEFHSEQSVLRIAVEHPGYEPARLELSASQPRLVARLVAKRLALDPARHSDPTLKALQEQINPALTKALLAVLRAKSDWTADLAGEARLRRIDERTILSVALAVAPQGGAGGQAADASAMARTVWDKVARRAALEVSAALGRPRGLDGIVVESRFDMTRQRFGVGHRIETRTEMRCVPGGRNEWVTTYDACASRDTRGFCQSGYKRELRYVHDPCASMQPSTMTDTKFETSSAATRDLTRAVYFLPVGTNAAKADFSGIASAVVDPRGKVLWRQGTLADGLLK